MKNAATFKGLHETIVIERDYVRDVLQKLLAVPSVTGNTAKAIETVETWFTELGFATRILNKGGLLVTIRPGEGAGTAFLAHVDTLGAVVKEIKSNGRLKVSRVGGYMFNAIEGENCQVETMAGRIITGTAVTTQSSTHIHSEAGKLERSEGNMEIRLDERVRNADDVRKLGIDVGDFVSFDPRIMLTESGFIKSRHLDDKAGVAAMLGAARHFAQNALPAGQPVYFYVTVHEEIGHGASAGLPPQVRDVFAVDMGAAGEGQNSDEYSVCICAKDSGGPYDLELRRQLVQLCRDYSIPHKVDVYSFYGSDAGAALRAGLEIRTGLFGPGVNASHAYERTHFEAVEASAALIAAWIMKM